MIEIFSVLELAGSARGCEEWVQEGKMNFNNKSKLMVWNRLNDVIVGN